MIATVCAFPFSVLSSLNLSCTKKLLLLILLLLQGEIFLHCFAVA